MRHLLCYKILVLDYKTVFWKAVLRNVSHDTRLAEQELEKNPQYSQPLYELKLSNGPIWWSGHCKTTNFSSDAEAKIKMNSKKIKREVVRLRKEKKENSRHLHLRQTILQKWVVALDINCFLNIHQDTQNFQCRIPLPANIILPPQQNLCMDYPQGRTFN